VRLWCSRFQKGGLAALTRERAGRGRRPGKSASIVFATLKTMRERSDRAVRWTTRSLAEAVGISAASVWRIWKHYRLGPTSSPHEIDRAIDQAIVETANRVK
jgi:transposase